MNATVKIPFEYQGRALIVELDCDFRCGKYDAGCYSGPMHGSYPAEGGDVEECKAELLGATENGQDVDESELRDINLAVETKLNTDAWEDLFGKLSSIYVESLYNDEPDYGDFV